MFFSFIGQQSPGWDPEYEENVRRETSETAERIWEKSKLCIRTGEWGFYVIQLKMHIIIESKRNN